MRVLLTPEAGKKISLFKKYGDVTSGFIIGTHIAKFTIIRDIIPLNFSKDFIDKVYMDLYDLWGDKLKGVFFRKNYMFFHELFFEKVVMEIDETNVTFSVYKLSGSAPDTKKKEKIAHIYE